MNAEWRPTTICDQKRQKTPVFLSACGLYAAVMPKFESNADKRLHLKILSSGKGATVEAVQGGISQTTLPLAADWGSNSL